MKISKILIYTLVFSVSSYSTALKIPTTLEINKSKNYVLIEQKEQHICTPIYAKKIRRMNRNKGWIVLGELGVVAASGTAGLLIGAGIGLFLGPVGAIAFASAGLVTGPSIAASALFEKETPFKVKRKKKVNGLAKVIRLLENDLLVSSDDILKNVEKRILTNYENRIQNLLKQHNQIARSQGLPMKTLEELKKEIPLTQKITFAERDKSVKGERTLVDVIAKQLNLSLDNKYQYEDLRSSINSYVESEGTSFCQKANKVYTLEEIAIDLKDKNYI